MIKITDKYYLTADKYSFSVGIGTIVKEGKNKGTLRVEWVVHFSRFEDCLKWITERFIADGIDSNALVSFLENSFKEMQRYIATITSHMSTDNKTVYLVQNSPNKDIFNMKHIHVTSKKKVTKNG